MRRSEYYIERPRIMLVGAIAIATPFLAADVSSDAKFLLGLAHQFRLRSSNLYSLCDNRTIAGMLQISHSRLMRAKKQLKDKKLLFYDGTPGNYAALRAHFKRRTGREYPGKL